MNRYSIAVLSLVAFLACGDDDRPADGQCTSDAHCAGELRCLEGACAVALQDPGGAPEAVGGPVRVFAVGWKPLLSEAATLETFDRAISDLVAGEVAPHLSAERPNLLVFPENTGLVAAFVGERNAAARAQPSAVQALLQANESWAGAVERYGDRSADDLSNFRLITLTWTDIQWRTLEGTFARIARELGVWVAVTYDTALAMRSTDTDDIAALVDPALADRSHAWVASTDDVHNQTLLFDPDGELVARWAKEYLVPLEESVLDLSYGHFGGVRAAMLPFGPTASVISKDAWMPDVLDRLALDGTRLMLQPEAFTGWITPTLPDGEWGPDVVKEGGWGHVMRYPEFRANVLPCMSANLIDLRLRLPERHHHRPSSRRRHRRYSSANAPTSASRGSRPGRPRTPASEAWRSGASAWWSSAPDCSPAAATSSRTATVPAPFGWIWTSPKDSPSPTSLRSRSRRATSGEQRRPASGGARRRYFRRRLGRQPWRPGALVRRSPGPDGRRLRRGARTRAQRGRGTRAAARKRRQRAASGVAGSAGGRGRRRGMARPLRLLG